MKKKIKEFHLKFYDRKIIPTSKNPYMQGLFPAMFDDKSIRIGLNFKGEVFKNFEAEGIEEFEDFSDMYFPEDIDGDYINPE